MCDAWVEGEGMGWDGEILLRGGGYGIGMDMI